MKAESITRLIAALLLDCFFNREEKSLRQVAMVANNNFGWQQNEKVTKQSIRTILNFTDLIQFHLICQIFAKFSFGPYLSFSKIRKRKRQFLYVFTHSKKRALEIRKFHVVVVQRWQRNVQSSVMHVQSC